MLTDMNRADFLTKFYLKYPKFFSSKELFNEWVEDYKLVLPESMDFKELYKRLVYNHTDMFKPPSPAELDKIRLQIQEEHHQESKKFVPFNDGVPPSKEFLDLRAKLEANSRKMQAKGYEFKG